MSDRSAIEWCDASWNPLRARNPETDRVGWHCERVSKGCGQGYGDDQEGGCYAERQNKGFFQLGTGLRYDRAARNKVEIFLDEKTLMQPLHWRKPRMIFVCSMTDLFGVFHSNEMINRVFAVMALASQHTFQVLTKRPERMREYLKEYAAGGLHLWRAAQSIEMPRGRHKPGTTWPLPHVWVGASIEDEPTARKRFADLVEAPAAVR